MKLIQQVEDLMGRVARLEGELGITTTKRPVGRPPKVTKAVPAFANGKIQRKRGKAPLGQKRWTDSQDGTVIGMYKRGTSGRDMARELGRTTKSVNSRIYVLKQAGKMS